MNTTHDVDVGAGDVRFATDFLGIQFHGDCHTHVDALCHIAYKDKLYNGRPAASVTSRHRWLLAQRNGGRTQPPTNRTGPVMTNRLTRSHRGCSDGPASDINPKGP